jgi:hypothetical protein
MKRFLLVGAIAALAVSIGHPSAAQVPGRGFSRLLCIAAQLAPELNGAQVNIDVLSDQVIDGYGTAVVTISHGTSSSTHTIAYVDNGSGSLDCGDVILSVS